MRIGFRTNLEQELVIKLKNEAKERNINMNDILEQMLYLYYGHEEESDMLHNFITKKPDSYPGEMKDYLRNEISNFVGKLMKMNDVNITDEFLETSIMISELIVKLAENENKKNNG